MSGLVGVSIGKWLGDNIDGLTYSETEESNIAINDMPTSPDHAVTIVDTGGYEPDSRLPYDNTHVQLIIRSDSASPVWALTTWEAIYQKIHGLRNVAMADGTLLVYSLVRQGNPISVGQDNTDRHQYVMNLYIELLNPSEWRPLEG
jgi:hypothetical protein